MDEQLLIRFLTHRCTPQERMLIEQWVALDPAHATWLFEMERVWSLKNELAFSREERIGAAYRRFAATRMNSSFSLGEFTELATPEGNAPLLASSGGKKGRFSLGWIRYAAAVLFIALLGLNLYQMRRTVSDGMNIVEVPPGEKASLTLSDGTHVWLNAGSRFSYPAAFTSANRRVELVGEGFFEVTPNPRAPFRVHTPSVEIKVLGTKFNLKAYSDEISRVTLTEGSVEVTAGEQEKLTLKPNEQAWYSNREGLRLVETVDAGLVTGWLDGDVAFVGESLAGIVREMQRKYAVCIRIDDPALSVRRFTCRAGSGASVLQVLDLLKKTRELDYRIQNDTIRIFKNEMPMEKNSKE